MCPRTTGAVVELLGLITAYLWLLFPLSAGEPLQLRERSRITIGGASAVVEALQDLPVVQTEYTKRFRFDQAANPKLKQLRQDYGLYQLVAGGETEFEQQVLLNDWVHRRFRKFGRPSNGARGALEILRGIESGHSFFCSQYAELLVSAAASLGWNDRLLALRRHQGVNARGGSTEHTTTEIWSNQYAKWIMLDPTSNMFVERGGIPLNAWEIRQEWFYRGGTNLIFVVGKERARYQKKDLPVFLERFADFGDLTIDPDELDKYGFIGYIPNTDLMDAGNDYAGMFIVKDQFCAGTKWHERTLPAHPESDPYFPINQVSLQVLPEGDHLNVNLATFTPNFQTFEVRVDNAKWNSTPAQFAWEPHPGENKLELRSVNAFGVKGPISRIRLSVTEGNSSGATP